MRAHRPIFNSSIAQELGYLPLESTAGAGQYNLAPNAADVVVKVSSPTLTLGAITITPAKATIVVTVGSPALTLPAPALTPGKGTVATKSNSPSLTLGAISVTPAKATVVVKAGVPTLTLGDITLTPNSATIVTLGGVPTFSGIPIDVYPDGASIVLVASEPLLVYFPPHVPGGHGDKPTWKFIRPAPPTQLEKEIKAMVDVYRTEAALRAGENAAERQRLQTLEMGRKQRDINTQLNRRPKERREAPQQPLIDGVKLQKMIERAQKQTQDEINLANKVKMAKVRAAKRKTKVKR